MFVNLKTATKKALHSETLEITQFPHLSEITAGFSTLTNARLLGFTGPVSSTTLDKAI